MERIATKRLKTYETPHPIELVMWANRLITPRDVWKPTNLPRLESLALGPFRRVWVVNLGGRDKERGILYVRPPLAPEPRHRNA